MDRAGCRTSGRAVPAGTAGLTILEILVAVILFTVAVAVGGRYVVGYVHQVGVSEARAQATEFALEEMERVRLLPYADIASVAPAPVPEAPEFTRSVEVAAVGNDPSAIYAYRLITVRVEPPGQIEPVNVTTAVAE